MSLDKKYLDQFINATEKAAYGASLFLGKGDKNAADKGAVDLMRNELNKIEMNGRGSCSIPLQIFPFKYQTASNIRKPF